MYTCTRRKMCKIFVFSHLGREGGSPVVVDDLVFPEEFRVDDVATDAEDECRIRVAYETRLKYKNEKYKWTCIGT